MDIIQQPFLNTHSHLDICLAELKYFETLCSSGSSISQLVSVYFSVCVCILERFFFPVVLMCVYLQFSEVCLVVNSLQYGADVLCHELNMGADQLFCSYRATFSLQTRFTEKSTACVLFTQHTCIK